MKRFDVEEQFNSEHDCLGVYDSNGKNISKFKILKKKVGNELAAFTCGNFLVILRNNCGDIHFTPDGNIELIEEDRIKNIIFLIMGIKSLLYAMDKGLFPVVELSCSTNENLANFLNRIGFNVEQIESEGSSKFVAKGQIVDIKTELTKLDTSFNRILERFVKHEGWKIKK